MQQTYWRLTNREREEISRSCALGISQADIAIMLHRHPSTVSEKSPETAEEQGIAHSRRGRERNAQRRLVVVENHALTQEDQLRALVIAGLRKCWSPREIVIRMKKEYPLDMTMRISHEAIYRYIYVLPRGRLKAILVKGLRQERAYRRKRKTETTMNSVAR